MLTFNFLEPRKSATPLVRPPSEIDADSDSDVSVNHLDDDDTITFDGNSNAEDPSFQSKINCNII